MAFAPLRLALDVRSPRAAPAPRTAAADVKVSQQSDSHVVLTYIYTIFRLRQRNAGALAPTSLASPPAVTRAVVRRCAARRST